MALDAKKSAALSGRPAPIEAGEPPALPTGELPSGKPQALVINGVPMVIMPKADYDVLIEAARDNIEDLAGAAEAMEILRRVNNGDEGTLPAEVVHRLSTESPIKVFREHHNMTQEQLGQAVGSDRLYISQLERGVRNPSLDMVRKLAAVFGVPLDLLTPKSVDTLPLSADETARARSILGDPALSELDIAAIHVTKTANEIMRTHALVLLDVLRTLRSSLVEAVRNDAAPEDVFSKQAGVDIDTARNLIRELLPNIIGERRTGSVSKSKRKA